jgi:manganese/zinc/iron transport system ATP- binding protein
MEPDVKALSVADLTIHYQSSPVLWDITLDVPQGVCAGILGPNGAGKSTFMKASLGLIPIAFGSIHILGKPFAAVRKEIAYVPQKEAIDWEFPITVKELVLMGAYPKLGMLRFLKKSDKERALAALESVGLQSVAKRQINQLSGGQKQRAFLARALMQDARCYFLDEPLAGVDMASEEIIMELLHSLKKDKKTILMVHHDLGNVEKYFDVVILLNIRLVACGPTQEVFSKKTLALTYGRNLTLFDEAMKLHESRNQGLRE